MNRFINWICRFVPTHFSNRLFLFCLQFMRRIQRNGRILAMGSGESSWDEEGFIENQINMKNIHMGMATIAEAGCEIIATYNVLYNVGKKVQLDKLIRIFVRDGILHSGKYGVAPQAIADCLKKNGCDVHTYIPGRKRQDVDGFTDMYETIVLTYYNDATDLMKEIHTIAVTRLEGGFVAHNAHCNGAVEVNCGKITDLISIITSGKGKILMAIGVNG
ncbi:MAG: hypothetical protein KBS96_02735 [Lachnospiraceae bacterium]|nr:hypothetical protein [Candidatus Colinaster scatohippi]